MNELAKFLAEMTPGVYGVWTGVFMGLAWWAKEHRETRKLSADDRLARREGYAAQVALLTKENRDLMADQRALREEYDKYRTVCHEETDQLRAQVLHLEGQIAGLLRKLAEAGIQAIRGANPGTVVSPMVADAAERSARHYDLPPAE